MAQLTTMTRYDRLKLAAIVAGGVMHYAHPGNDYGTDVAKLSLDVVEALEREYDRRGRAEAEGREL